MEWLLLPITLLCGGIGLALVFHGFNIVTIHKHYHVKKEGEN